MGIKLAFFTLVASLSMLAPVQCQALAIPFVDVNHDDRKIELIPGLSVGQTFIAREEQFSSIKVKFVQKAENTLLIKSVLFTLSDAATGQVLHQEHYYLPNIGAKSYHQFVFPAVTRTKGKKYLFTLQLAEKEPDLTELKAQQWKQLLDSRLQQGEQLAVWAAEDNRYQFGRLVVNGQKQPELDMNFTVIGTKDVVKEDVVEEVRGKLNEQKVFFGLYGLLILFLTTKTIFLIIRNNK